MGAPSRARVTLTTKTQHGHATRDAPPLGGSTIPRATLTSPYHTLNMRAHEARNMPPLFASARPRAARNNRTTENVSCTPIPKQRAPRLRSVELNLFPVVPYAIRATTGLFIPGRCPHHHRRRRHSKSQEPRGEKSARSASISGVVVTVVQVWELVQAVVLGVTVSGGPAPFDSMVFASIVLLLKTIYCAASQLTRMPALLLIGAPLLLTGSILYPTSK